ncbi:MAG: sn-glycerol-3-phosphate ABC transporter ATP-binding protein UgpC [Verrucomicrobia bacterium]|nr:sn-glycerol-3-phosphate ABC transporter ATP-binding protein UgpC [Verrucomicrobiota bacterium]
MATVSLQNLYKTYPGGKTGEVTAVRDFNLEIADREFIVFVGPSGCGKSTTLRMIAGLESISRGELCIDGVRMNDTPPKDRDIAMVFQNYALYPHLTVFENLAFGLKLRKTPKDEIQRRVAAAAEILGLGQLLDRTPKALSGGQCQRVAVGRAIVRQPKVFLFDEPLSNLDAKMRVQMRAEIIKLHRRLQATMIYVTHDQIEAMTMGTRIVVMDAVLNPATGLKEGIVQQIDTPLKIYHEPANLFVAGFLGSPPMNFFKGTLHQEPSGLVFRENAPGTLVLPLPERPATTAHLGRELILGLRPENCRLAGHSTATDFQATLEMVEPMGSETYLYAHTGAHAFISKNPVGHESLAPGTRQHFHIDAERAHFFDPATQLRLPV